MEVNIEQMTFSKVSPESVIDWGTLRLMKVKRNYVLSGKFRLLQEADNGWNVSSESK